MQNTSCSLRRYSVALSLAATLLLSGCSTMMARTSSRHYPRVYPGVHFYFNDFLQHPHMIPKWLSIPSGFLDVPASFVVDTLCLPVDAINTMNEGPKKND